MKEYDIVKLKTKDIKLDNENPNKMSPDMNKRLSGSLDEFGNTQPVVVDKNTMLLADGEHRLKDYIKRGIEEIPAILVDFKSESHRRAYRQAANKIHGEHDLNMDAQEYLKILEAQDKELLRIATGMNMTDVENHLRRLELLNKEEDFDLDKEVEDIKEPISKTGDIYLLGKHRLMCGDSTKEEDVNKLMNEITPILMVTDPPYGVNYDPKWRDEADKNGILGNRYPTRALGNVMNDDIVDWSKAYKLFKGDVAYVWHAGKFTSEVQKSLQDCDFEPINQIIWVKPHFALSRGDYHWRHEPCWYVVRKGKSHNWQGSRKEDTVWEIAGMNAMGASHDIADKSTGHGTQKPIECFARSINNNTKEQDIIYDPFIGSGTSLIAAEKLQRICYCMEIEPIYCDVIIRRWEKFTGKKAIKEVKQ